MKPLWILAPVGAAVLIAPLATKPIALNQIDNAIVEVDKNANNMGFLLERQTEEQGLLSSTFVTRVRALEGIEDSSQELCLDFKTEVSHSFTDILQGNFASTSTTLVPMSEQDERCGIKNLFASDQKLSAFYEKNYSDKSPMTINSAYGILGSAKASFEISEFKIDIPKNDQGEGPVSITSEALTGDIQFADSMQSYTYQMSWDGLSALIEESSGPVKIRISGMTGDGEQYLAHKNIWLGSLNQEFTDLSISKIGEFGIKKYTLPSLHFYSNAYEDSNGIQSQIVMTAENINGNLGDFVFDLSLSNLDAEALSAVTEIFDSLDPGNKFEKVNLDGQKEALIHYAKILVQKASLNINSVKYSIDGQEINLDGVLKAPAMTQLNIDAVMMNPMALLAAVQFELNGKVDKGFSEALSEPLALAMSENPDLSDEELDATKVAMKTMVDGQLAAGVGMGFLVDNGATYNSQLKFDNGMPMINGQPMQLPTLPDQQ